MLCNPNNNGLRMGGKLNAAKEDVGLNYDIDIN